jgi:hypothetical protein
MELGKRNPAGENAHCGALQRPVHIVFLVLSLTVSPRPHACNHMIGNLLSLFLVRVVCRANAEFGRKHARTKATLNALVTRRLLHVTDQICVL